MKRSTQGVRALITAPLWHTLTGYHTQLLAESGLDAKITTADITRDEQLALIREVRPQVAVIGDDVWDQGAFELAKANGLVCVSRHGTGVHPDMKAGAEATGIGLANTPGTTETPVSELTVGLILAALRRIPTRNAEMANGVWNRVPGEEIRGKRVLVIGSGFIGSATARLLVPFGADVTLMSRKKDDKTEQLVGEFAALKGGAFPLLGEKFGNLTWSPAANRATTLASADIVVLLCPMTGETTGMVDDAFLATMKTGATLVSMSRGGLIKDEAAVVNAVRDGKLGAFATDVFQKEPIRSLPDSAYLGVPDDIADRIICLPHVGWLTTANLERQLGAALANVIHGYAGEPEKAMNWVVPLKA